MNLEAVSSNVELIKTKTKTETFNHVNFYIIHNKSIWYRPINDPNIDWKRVPYNGTDPIEIQADGANLVIIDEQNEVHYKKVLIESRKKGVYSKEDISEENNWNDRWYRLPIIEKIYNYFVKNKRLYLLPGTKACAISHRGMFSCYFEDIRGKKHTAFPMVTSFYAFIENTNFIVYADPYLMDGFSQVIEGPHPDFIIEALSASASTLFISGKLHGKTKRYTKRADFDMTGKNPFLLSFWSKKNRSDPKWFEQPDLPDDATDHICIYQVGEGNSEFILQVTSLNGIYAKKIYDHEWVLTI